MCHFPHCAGYISTRVDSQVAMLHIGADVPFSANHSLFFQNSCVQARLMKTFSPQKLSRLKIWFNLRQNSKENVVVAENI